jgi:peptidoglycan/xylan/chitin deacetylase (PgdA/CDA1 family)
VNRRDAGRSAALTLWGHGDAGVRQPPKVLSTGTPSQPRRLYQALAVKRGRIDWESGIVRPLMDFRREALGDGAAGQPRALVRVDEFPHAAAFDSAGRFGTEAFKRFHAVLAEAGIPYLLAITPHVSRDYLNPKEEEWRRLDAAEIAELGTLEGDGVTFGLHGLDHRTRHPSPRRHSEFCGLSAGEAAARIDLARSTLAELGIETPVFVPPFNRFDASQYALLAQRFDVVCGGPESIRLLGFRPTPVWDGEAVYLPSYAPLYGRAGEVAGEIERMLAAEEALWAPVTLHWGWELEDDFAGLKHLCRRLAECATDWRRFLEAVRESRAAA